MEKTVCSEYILNRVARIIWVRDLFEAWYLAGIIGIIRGMEID